MEAIHTTDFAEAIREIQQAAALAQEPILEELDCPDGKGGKLTVPIAFVPAGEGKVAVHPLLEVMKQGAEFARAHRLSSAEGPDSRQGVAAHQSLTSFIDHANRFRADHSAVWANRAERKLVSVLDYHPAGAKSPAGWGRHKGLYSCPLSEAWQAWGGGKALELDQDEFAALLDSRDRELIGGTLPTGKAAPDPSALITLASNLEVYSTATAKRERDPNTGRVKISFSEDKGVSGTIVPPPSFLILIPVFEDGEAAPLEVRLRVVVENGQAAFHVQIHAATTILRQAFDGLCERVKSETQLPLFVGNPE